MSGIKKKNHPTLEFRKQVAAGLAAVIKDIFAIDLPVERGRSMVSIDCVLSPQGMVMTILGAANIQIDVNAKRATVTSRTVRSTTTAQKALLKVCGGTSLGRLNWSKAFVHSDGKASDIASMVDDYRQFATIVRNGPNPDIIKQAEGGVAQADALKDKPSPGASGTTQRRSTNGRFD